MNKVSWLWQHKVLYIFWNIHNKQNIYVYSFSIAYFKLTHFKYQGFLDVRLNYTIKLDKGVYALGKVTPVNNHRSFLSTICDA